MYRQNFPQTAQSDRTYRQFRQGVGGRYRGGVRKINIYALALLDQVALQICRKGNLIGDAQSLIKNTNQIQNQH